MASGDLARINVYGVDLELAGACPCQSGRSLHECCLVANSVFKQPARIVVKRQPLAIQNRKCYARSTYGCSKSITREHYLTRALMDYLEEHGQGTFRGFSFLKEGKGIPGNKVVAKVLCDAHNPALSPLDAEILRLFKAIHAPRPGLTLFNGQDIERWMVKAALGMTAAGVVRKGGTPSHSDPNSPWVKYLFTNGARPSGRVGLFLGRGQAQLPLLKVAPLEDEMEIIGFEAVITGVPLLFAGVPPNPDYGVFVGATRHPTHLRLSTAETIAFSWPEHEPAKR